MGEVDIAVLHDINKKVKELEKANNWGFIFKTDDGSFETAIEFTAIGYHHPPKSNSWDEAKQNGNEIKCPDLLDYRNKIIIEYEEEPRPGKKGGKMGRKGHTEESQRDSNRDMLYRIGGFRIFKVWETDYKENNYNKKLWKFLCDCYTKRI